MTLLLIIGIAALALLLRPTPHTHVVYVPVEVADERGGAPGCAPVIFAAALAALIIALVGGI